MNPGSERDPAEGTRGIPAPFVISVAGIPGSGKTTLFDRIATGLAARDLDVGRLPAIARADHEPHFRAHHPDFWETSRTLIDAASDDAETARRRSMWWFLSASRVEQARTDSSTNGHPVLVEEPMVHEIWRLSHWLGHDRRDDIHRLLELTPRCDLLFHIQTSSTTARNRIRSKGAEEQGPVNRQLASAEPVDDIWTSGLAVYDELLDLSARHCEVVVVDNDADATLDDNVAAMVSRIARHAEVVERGWLGRSVRSMRNAIGR